MLFLNNSIPPLSGMTIPELTEALLKISKNNTIPPYRAKQIFSWIKNGAGNFRDMSSLPLSLIKALEENAIIRASTIKEMHKSSDGTIKLVMSLPNNALIETVLLDSNLSKKSHFTACLSTQAGCPLGCVFCKTGTMGFIRNLETSEIIEQFLYLNDELKKSKGDQTDQKISHIVVMGMGEPLLNLPSLRKALELLCSPSGYCLSKRKITVSTAGISSGIIDLAENGPEIELAVSISSADQGLRSRLMPGLSRHPLSELKEALVYYRKKTGRRITLEMVLLGGINTNPEDARSLINFAKNIDVVINLIPWNPVKDLYFEGKRLKECSQKEIEKFTQMLESGGLAVTRRFRRGRSIAGACGQLGINSG